MGGERQTLIDVELKRTEFRLDVLKLRKQLSEIGVGRNPDTPSSSAVAVVTTRAGTAVEPSGEAPATVAVVGEPEPARTGSSS